TVARRLVDDFPDGVGWGALSQVNSTDAVLQTVAGAFGIREVPGRPLLQTVLDELAGRAALLLLDNCEHLVYDVALLAEQLLAGAPGLRVLATSRERLRLPVEVVRPVAPLPVPRGSTPTDLAESPAADLFLRRARQLVPDLTIDPGGEAAVAHICRELDGLPLALELAAARVNVLSVEQIAASIDEAAEASRGTSPRQRTLRATLDWSYRLLTPHEQDALTQLAVFTGGWTLPA